MPVVVRVILDNGGTHLEGQRFTIEDLMHVEAVSDVIPLDEPAPPLAGFLDVRTFSDGTIDLWGDGADTINWFLYLWDPPGPYLQLHQINLTCAGTDPEGGLNFNYFGATYTTVTALPEPELGVGILLGSALLLRLRRRARCSLASTGCGPTRS